MKKTYLFKSLLIGILISISSLAFGQKYTGLTAESTGTDAQPLTNMFDDDMTTRWESEKQNAANDNNVDAISFIVDLGASKYIGYIEIFWEYANAKDYSISFSDDKVTFSNTQTFSYPESQGTRTDIIYGLQTARYIKFQGISRPTKHKLFGYGYSIYEFHVYPEFIPQLTSIVVTPELASIKLEDTQKFTAQGKNQAGSDYPIDFFTWSTSDSDNAIVDYDGNFTPLAKGAYIVTASYLGINGAATVEVLSHMTNLALGGTASASTTLGERPPSLANDNNLSTRWESEHKVDPQWYMVDLGAVQKINDIFIYWDAANAKDYTIEISTDGNTWTNVATRSIETTDAGNRTDVILDLGEVEGRYVRMNGTSRNLDYGYSIYEFKVFGNTTTGIKANNTSSVVIWLDQNNNKLHFSSEIANAKVYSLSGQMLTSIKNSDNISTHNLASGVYLITITDQNNMRKSMKFIIQ